MGVFARIMMGLAEQAPDIKAISIDATYLLPGSGLLVNLERVKAHRTASSLRLKRGERPPDWTDQGRHEYQIVCDHRHQRTTYPFLYHSRAPSQRCKHRLSGNE